MSVWTAMGLKRQDVFQAIMEGEDQGHDEGILNWLMRWGLIIRHEREDGTYRYRVPERTRQHGRGIVRRERAGFLKKQKPRRNGASRPDFEESGGIYQQYNAYNQLSQSVCNKKAARYCIVAGV